MTRRPIAVALLPLALALAATDETQAQSGQLDTGFAGDGANSFNVTGNSPDRGQSIAIDGSGNLVVAGYTGSGTNGSFLVARFTAAGALDVSFDGDGWTTTAFTDNPGNGNTGSGVAIDSLGRIVVAGPINGRLGNSEVGIARYLSTGALDTSFDADGKVEINVGAIDSPQAMAVDSSDRIVTAGHTSTPSNTVLLTRTLVDGSPDASFGTGGVATGTAGFARALLIDSSGRLLIAGFTSTGNASDLILQRFNSDGSLDASFGGAGTTVFDLGGKEQAYALAFDASGRIITAGSTGVGATARMLVTRFSADGVLDTSFGGGDGYVEIAPGGAAGVAYGLGLDAGGNILVTGTSGTNTGIAKLDDTGTPDPGFGTNGSVSLDIAAVEAVAGQQDTGYALAVVGPRIYVTGQVFVSTANNFDLMLAAVTNATPGELIFSAPTYSAGEADGTATITVSRIGGSDGAVGVTYASADGTATAGTDYTAATGTLSWADGDAADKSFNVAITNDSLDEDDETVQLALSLPTGGATLGAPNAATLTIVDEDPTPSLSINDANVVEGDSGTAQMSFTVSLSAASGKTVQVDYATLAGTATAGADFTSTSGTLSFSPGTTTQQVLVDVLGDTLVEGDENFSVNLSNPVEATIADAQGIGTIADDDVAGSLQFSIAAISAGEESGSVTVSVTRTGGTDGAVSVNYATADGSATAGSDYTATNGTLNWADGDGAAKTFSITLLDDNADEVDETVLLNLSAPTGAAIIGNPATATLSIVDNDVGGSLGFAVANYTVAENGGSITLSVQRTGGSDGAVSIDYATVDGTATAGQDYTAVAGTAQWAHGDTSPHSIVVPILNDTVFESDETFSVVLSNVSGASAGAIATAQITINRGAGLAQPTVVPAGSAPSLALLLAALSLIAAFALRRDGR
jgi:uncharacterized delta-60 repeat protein